jgi:CheY-like chemotaxis protein
LCYGNIYILFRLDNTKLRLNNSISTFIWENWWVGMALEKASFGDLEGDILSIDYRKVYVPYKKKKKILIVEDQNIISAIIQQNLLIYMDIQSIVADDGEEGLKIYRQSHNDIGMVLMDILLKKMNGDEATLAIRHYEIAEKISPVPIIAVSGNLKMLDININYGFTECIGKPFDPRKIIDCVNKYSRSYEEGIAYKQKSDGIVVSR